MSQEGTAGWRGAGCKAIAPTLLRRADLGQGKKTTKLILGGGIFQLCLTSAGTAGIRTGRSCKHGDPIC